MKLLVGLWPQGEAVLTDTDLSRRVGADAYAWSLRGAVEACLREAGATATSGEASATANAA